MRLLSRNSVEYLNGPTQMWDVGGDSFDAFDGVGVLESAELSIDEPEFEMMIFQSE
uniref:Uncharacterized protein n=1 Tax=Arundo donax TaxID=35708 RepID=A0A0A9BAH5_ARUDO